ncbi:MAG: hypothetical protein IJ489_04770 [Clostridia bacterium]|nr:hypothetical protein [Clostridia bacterium]
MNGDFSDKLSQILSNPAMMAQIKSLADTMTASEGIKEQANEKTPEASEQIPVAERAERSNIPAFFTPSPTFEKNMRNTCALLTALKPFLDDRRCDKIDKMLSMIHFAEMAGKLGDFF